MIGLKNQYNKNKWGKINKTKSSFFEKIKTTEISNKIDQEKIKTQTVAVKRRMLLSILQMMNI